MKAVVYARYGSPRYLEVGEAETPGPGPGEVLVAVHAASANALDYRRFESPGAFGRLMDERILRVVGKPLGADIAGVVHVAGQGVTGLRPGDEVYGVAAGDSGGFAEYARASERQLALKPRNLSFLEAAAVPTAAVTALQGLRFGRLRPGIRVLVHGASGGVGSFAVQIARASGATVTAVCSARNADAARSLGVEAVIDYASRDFTAESGRWDLVLGVNGDRSILDYRRALAAGGVYSCLGGSIRQIMQGMLLGPLLSVGSGKRLGSIGVAKVTTADLERLGEWLATSSIAPVIERVIPMEEVADAIAQLAQGHARGKVVVRIRP